MKSSTVALLAVAAGAAVVFAIHDAHASASQTAVFPAGFTPPGNSVTRSLPATNPTQLALKATAWSVAADAGGTQAGNYQVFQNQAAPGTDWAVFFNGAPIAVGDTSNSKLIAQAVAAGLVK
jgi:hypothetical protein